MYTAQTAVDMTKRLKHLKLDQSKIDRARRLFGTKTEQETIELALDLALAEEPLARAHRKIRGVGGITDAFSR
jgi:hypothetical protein